MKHSFLSIKAATTLLVVLLCLAINGCFCFSIFNPSMRRSEKNGVQYDINLSKDYVILGVASYCPKKCLLDWSCEITKNHLPNDTVTDVTHMMGTITRASGFVAYDATKDLIVISYRGSANIENWIQDFTFLSVPYSRCNNCKVHLGFLEDYKAIEKPLLKAVDELVEKHPNASILTTGHSLGGAISVIAGIQMKLKYNRYTEIHNFGQPRVGNAAFANYVQTKVDKAIRLVHNRDIVPHLPPKEFGFHHSAYQVLWDKHFESHQICSQSGQDQQCSNKYSPAYNAGDHSFYFWDLGRILKC